MGIDTRERIDEFHFQFDSSRKSLNVAFELQSEGISRIKAFAEVSGLVLEHLGDPTTLSTARLTRAGLTYEDFGYFSRRNHFCAQWLGSNSTDFVSRHVGAVGDFLSSRGIVPGKELLSLYEKFVSQGGTLSLTSLPDASWIPAEIEAYPREALLRQLNITARLKDAPPIMLRLAFADPEAPVKLAGIEATAAAAQVEPVVETAAVATPDPAAEVLAKIPVPTAQAPTVESPVALSAPVAEAPASHAQSPNKPVAQTVASEPVESVPSDGRRVIASAPAPPKDSTLALVWKPGEIERLPQAPVRNRRYRVVTVSELASLGLADVQLLTSNGKRIDGQVKQVLGDHLVLEIRVVQGNAELNVPLDKVREVRIFDRTPQKP